MTPEENLFIAKKLGWRRKRLECSITGNEVVWYDSRGVAHPEPLCLGRVDTSMALVEEMRTLGWKVQIGNWLEDSGDTYFVNFHRPGGVGYASARALPTALLDSIFFALGGIRE